MKKHLDIIIAIGTILLVIIGYITLAYTAHWPPFDKSVSTSVGGNAHVASSIGSPDLEITDNIKRQVGGMYIFIGWEY